MKLLSVSIRNFRRLEDVEIAFEEDNTVFVGPNNSGKTTATAAFRLFLNKSSFSIHDFTVSRINDLNAFGAQVKPPESLLPAIEMDFWFMIDPDIEFGRVFSLIPNISSDFDEVGIRLKFCVNDTDKLKQAYESASPRTEDDANRKSMYDFLSESSHLSRHFSFKYYMLERLDSDIQETEMEPEEGRRVINSLIRVDFLEAQRNIYEQDVGRSNRLSSAFAAYYKKNLEKPAANEEAKKVIDENNARLTEHYGIHFKSLFESIAQLGVPSVHDRSLKLKSALNAQEILKGSTELLYVDSSMNHELPEDYNGLGFKNLVYMAIQINDFQLQWISTEARRPLCQLIFIEEPEVHLHAQAQQTFIANIWSILRDNSKKAGEPSMAPQLAISTHSSHIVDTLDFARIRYFQRCPLSTDNPNTVLTYNASNVLNLSDYIPDEQVDPIDFLRKYLKLTHCDLLFADAAVLVEGTVEKLLIPQMIEKSAAALRSRYLTILEVGGAHAYRFAGLIKFIGIPYLVITDIDAVSVDGKHPACRADEVYALTSNETLKFYLKKNSVRELAELGSEAQVVQNGACYVAYQKPVPVTLGDHTHAMHGRTLEEAFVYENILLFNADDLGIELPGTLGHEETWNAVYDQISKSTFKKTDFALGITLTANPWNTPVYIADGLKWLESKLMPSAKIEIEEAKMESEDTQ